MDLPIIDIVILLIVLASAVWGIFKGFVAQIVSILALIFGVWCAFKFSNYCSAEIKNFFSLATAQSTITIIMFVIILLLILILGRFIGKGIEGVIKLSMLEWLNRALGFVFAALKAIIILSLIIYVLDCFNNTWHFIPKETLQTSKGYLFLNNFSAKLFPYLQNIVK